MLGYRELSEAFGVTLAGGDTTRSAAGITINVTAIGRIADAHIKRRSGARPGDAILVAGELGAFGRRAARHPRRALRHPRRRSPPQPAAPSGRRHLARRTPRNTRHDGPFGRAGLGHPPHHGAFGGRRRDRHRPYPRRPRGRRPKQPPAGARITSSCSRPTRAAAEQARRRFPRTLRHAAPPRRPHHGQRQIGVARKRPTPGPGLARVHALLTGCWQRPPPRIYRAGGKRPHPGRPGCNTKKRQPAGSPSSHTDRKITP